MKKLDFEAIAKIDKDIAIGISNKFNAVFSVDMKTGFCDYIGIVPGEEIAARRLYTKAIFINGKVYFIPCSAEHIAVYDVNTKTIYTIDIKGADRSLHAGYKIKQKFNGVAVYENCIFLIPCTYPGVIRIVVNTDSLTYYDTWIKKEKYLFRKSVLVYENSFFVPSVINNIVFRFNMQTCEGELEHIGQHNNGCWSMCTVDENFWMAPKEQGSIIRWNLKTGKIKEFEKYPEGFQGKDFLFTQIYYNNYGLNFVPAYANMWISVDVTSGEMKNSNMIDMRGVEVINIMFEMEEYLFLLVKSGENENHIRINKINNDVDEYEFEFKNGFDVYCKIYETTIRKSKSIIKEKSFWGLQNFIHMIIADEK